MLKSPPEVLPQDHQQRRVRFRAASGDFRDGECAGGGEGAEVKGAVEGGGEGIFQAEAGTAETKPVSERLAPRDSDREGELPVAARVVAGRLVRQQDPARTGGQGTAAGLPHRPGPVELESLFLAPSMNTIEQRRVINAFLFSIIYN